MENSAETEVKKPEWFSEIKPVTVLTLSPEDVWEVMSDEKKSSITKEEFIGIFNDATKMLSNVSDDYWDTIRDAISWKEF